MRWAGLSLLVGLAVGLSVGLALGLTLAPTRVVMRSEAAAPLAPSMSVSRFLQCSEAEADEFTEGEWQALNTMHHWRPEGFDWPTP